MRRSSSAIRAMALAAGVAALLAGMQAPVAGSVAGSEDAPAADARRAPSAAGTLVYIKAHNLWIARGDGTGERRLTGDGTATKPYASPSQSSGGVIAVGLGDEIVRMSQDGTVLNRINPAPLISTTSHPLDGPVQDVEISPDGTQIVYTLASYQCPPGVSCMARTASSVTRADRFTRDHGQTYYRQSSWVGNGRLIQSGGYLHQIMLVDLGQEPVHWFDDHEVAAESTDLGDAALSPNGRSLVAIRGYGEDTHAVWYSVNGNAGSGPAPGLPDWLCMTSKDAKLHSPTWSPDSTTMAWGESTGVWVKYDPGAERCGTPEPQLLIAGAEQPHWSAAALQPAKKQDDQSGSKLRSLAKPKIKGTAKVGRALKATPGKWSRKPKKVRYQWFRGGKAIKGATKRTYVVRKADRGKRLSVRVTARIGKQKAVRVKSKAVKVRGR